MAQFTFPDTSQQVKDQLITYVRSHKVERRMSLYTHFGDSYCNTSISKMDGQSIILNMLWSFNFNR